MTLRFIIGRAGVGKTHLCLEEINSKMQDGLGKTRILLVPEQATFQMEKMLLEYCGVEGTMDTQVLSFQRLAWRVLQETGGGIQPVIDDLGKSLVLRLLIEQNGDKLKAFRRVMDKPGFIAKLRESIAEFKVYKVATDRLAQCLEELKGEGAEDLQCKIEDLLILYSAYQQYLSDKYLDSDDYMRLLAEKMHSAPLLLEAEVWIDGFHGFTPLELEVLRELLIKFKQVNITLCLDGSLLQRKLSETDLFYPSWETFQRLQQIAQEVNCPLLEHTVLVPGAKQRFSEKSELAALESHLVTGHPPCPEKAEALKLVAASSRRVELEGVAREITRLCREEGFRYKDIALLIRNIDCYENLLPIVFGEFSISYFDDRKRPLVQHPLLDLLRGVLEVAEKGWKYEPIFRYLKTDLVPVSRKEVDLLENYCLAYGIRGGRWTDGKPWTYRKVLTLNQDDDTHNEPTQEERAFLRRINKARQKASTALYTATLSLKDGRYAIDYVQALYALLEDLSVAKKLEYWSKTAEDEGLLEDAQIHGQVWHMFIDLVDQLVEVLGQEELSLQQFINILESGLESIEMGLIPPGLDQVLIGSVDRSRNPALKAVFLLGVNEGILPARYFDQRLINDDERQILSKLDVNLAPTGSQLLFTEQFVIYNALTRASEYLWISYPMSDEEGKALSPSLLMQRLALWLQEGSINLAIQELIPAERGQFDLADLTRPAPVLNALAQALRLAVQGQEIDPYWFGIYNWYLKQEKWQEPLSRISAALLEQNREDNLTREEAGLLYGLNPGGGRRTQFSTSISRLEKYKACPYAHFINYGLHLKEREEFKLKSPDLGQFFHAALEGIYSSLAKQNQALLDLSASEIKMLIEQVVEDLIPRLQNELLLSTARYRYLSRKLKRTVERAVTILREHERRGTFRPLGIELSFGPRGTIPGLQLTLRDGTIIELQGRIDRVDGALGPQGYYLRVIDYKSGSPGLSLLEVFYGLKLQLLAYLQVLLKEAPALVQQEARPGGVLYFSIQDPFITSDGPLAASEVEKRILKELKMKGYLLKENEAVKAMDGEINGYSDLIPAGLSTNGDFYKSSESLLSEEQFSGLCRHVEKLLTEISEEILAGNTAIQPYRYKGKKACKFCLYQAICRFDPVIPGNSYRNLGHKDPVQVWEEMGIQRGET